MTSCDLFLVLLARKIKGAVPAVPAVASVPSPFQSTGRIRDGADGAYGALGPAELIPDNHENRHGIPLHILFTHILSTQRLLKLRCNISESQQDPEFFSWNTFHSNMSGVMISEMQKKNHVHAVYSLVDSLPRFIASGQRATRLCSKGWYHQPISNISR